MIESLNGRDFTGQDLRGTDFIDAVITNCKFDHTDLGQANFTGATLENCSFDNADLTNANFTDARFQSKCTMDGANVQGLTWNGCDAENIVTDVRVVVEKAEGIEQFRNVRDLLKCETLSRILIGGLPV